MHQSLDHLLPPSVMPETLCEFSAVTTDALRLRVGSVSCRDPHGVQFHLDEIDAAVAEVSQLRVDTCFAQGEVEMRMREIQRDYVIRPDLKITQAERLYKIDEQHRELEALLVKLKAIVKHCDTTEDLLKNKYFEIKAKMRLA